MSLSMRQGPSLEALASKITVTGKKGKCALILPVDTEIGLLNAHLKALGNQTISDFDVIIAHPPSLDVSKMAGGNRFGVITISMKEQLGAGGNYYAAELYALQNGYECIILADVDCVPLSNGLVQGLCSSVSRQPGRISSPIWKPFEGSKSKSFAFHWYKAMHRSVLEQAGLSFLPFYLGCVDSELEARISKKSGNQPYVYLEDAYVYHPFSKNAGLERSSERTLYEARNAGSIIFLYPSNAWFWFVGLASLCSFCFFDSFANFAKRAKIVANLLRSMVHMDMGCDPSFRSIPFPSYREIKLGDIPRSAKRNAAIIVKPHLGKEKTQSIVSSLYQNGFACKVLDPGTETGFLFPLAKSIVKCSLSADALLVCISPKYFFSPFLLLSKSLYLHDGEKTYAIYKDKGIALRIFHFAASMFSVALFSLAYLLISVISALRLKDFINDYGLDSLKK